MYPTVWLILPTYGHLDYAARAAASFKATTPNAAVYALDDATPGMTWEGYSEWCGRNQIDRWEWFAQNDGLTRSWNEGLRWIDEGSIVVCGNSDLVFSPGWFDGIAAALEKYDLVGPITNASGWGTPLQNISHYGTYTPDDSDEALAQVAAAIKQLPTVALPGPEVTYEQHAANMRVSGFLNGFCMVAYKERWNAAAYDDLNTFNPAHKLTENETELQLRAVTHGMSRAVVPSSFVFHYRAVSRGDEFKCEGAFRP